MIDCYLMSTLFPKSFLFFLYIEKFFPGVGITNGFFPKYHLYLNFNLKITYCVHSVQIQYQKMVNTKTVNTIVNNANAIFFTPLEKSNR